MSEPIELTEKSGELRCSSRDDNIRWFRSKFWFYGPIVVCYPSTYFQVGSHTCQPSGLTLEALTNDREYTEISGEEAVALIGKKNRRGARWTEGIAKAMELCGKLD